MTYWLGLLYWLRLLALASPFFVTLSPAACSLAVVVRCCIFGLYQTEQLVPVDVTYPFFFVLAVI